MDAAAGVFTVMEYRRSHAIHVEVCLTAGGLGTTVLTGFAFRAWWKAFRSRKPAPKHRPDGQGGFMIRLTLLLIALLLSGCAGTDLVESGHLTSQPTLTRTMVRAPEIREVDGKLVVSGRVVRDAWGGFGGHVEVTIAGPDGGAFGGATVEYRGTAAPLGDGIGPCEGFFRRTSPKYGFFAGYKVWFAQLPPPGSVVRVRHVSTGRGPP